MRVKRLSIPISLLGVGSIQARIALSIRYAVNSESLKVGDALPSSRELASVLAVSRNSVLNAISSLVAEGLLETRGRAGTYVKSKPDRLSTTRLAKPTSHVLSNWARELPSRPGILRTRDAECDFVPGVPDLQLFPSDEWRRSAMRKLRTLRVRLGSYGPPEGDPELRQEIARYVSRSRSVVCTSENILVTNGAQQAFDLIARVLISPGMSVAVEEPGYRAASLVFRAAGAHVRCVQVDEEGLVVDRLPNETRIIYVTPSHQYPLGVAMSARRRKELLAWAHHHDALIIEDDYDSEFRYNPELLPSLQGSDVKSHVIYVGTFSKILMPGIRLGYLVAPQWMSTVLVGAKWLTDRHSESIAQSVLADFMMTGAFVHHISKMQANYAVRYRALLDAFQEGAMPGLKILPSQAGLHVCIALERRLEEQALIRAAAAEGVGVYGLAGTFQETRSRSGLVLGFGNLAVSAITDGIWRLKRAVAKIG